MSYEEYRAKRRQDPEYRKVERQLKPILDLADDVFYLRMERGWSQGELARRIGTRQANISRLENGLANPTFGFLQKLSEVFETDLTVRLRPQPIEMSIPVETPTSVIVVYQEYADREGHTWALAGKAVEESALSYTRSQIANQVIVEV